MSTDIIQDVGVMAVKVPDQADHFEVIQPENIAFSTFKLVIGEGSSSETKTIDSNVEFSDVQIAGKNNEIEDMRLKAWCDKMGISAEDRYVLLRLKY